MALINLYSAMGGSPSPGGEWYVGSVPDPDCSIEYSVNGGPYTVQCGPTLPFYLSTIGMTNSHLVTIETTYMRPGVYTFIYDITGVYACTPSPAATTLTVFVDDYTVNTAVNVSQDPICEICGVVNGGSNFTITFTGESNFNQGGDCPYPTIPSEATYILSWKKMGSQIKAGSNVNPVFTVGVDADLSNPLTWPDEVTVSYLTSCGQMPQTLPISYNLGLNVCANAQNATYCYNTGIPNNQINLANLVPPSGWAGTLFNWYFLGVNTPGAPSFINFVPTTTTSLLYSVQGASNGDVYYFRLEATRPSNPAGCTHYVDVAVTMEYSPVAGNFVTTQDCYS